MDDDIIITLIQFENIYGKEVFDKIIKEIRKEDFLENNLINILIDLKMSLKDVFFYKEIFLKIK